MIQACVDAILIFGIPYFVSLEPGDVWGSDAYGGKEIFLGTMREEKDSQRLREMGSNMR